MRRLVRVAAEAWIEPRSIARAFALSLACSGRFYSTLTGIVVPRAAAVLGNVMLSTPFL